MASFPLKKAHFPTPLYSTLNWQKCKKYSFTSYQLAIVQTDEQTDGRQP